MHVQPRVPTSQQWTGYNDGTLRMNGKCLDISGPEVGATGAAADHGDRHAPVAADRQQAHPTGPRTRLAIPNGLTPQGTPASSD